MAVSCPLPVLRNMSTNSGLLNSLKPGVCRHAAKDGKRTGHCHLEEEAADQILPDLIKYVRAEFQSKGNAFAHGIHDGGALANKSVRSTRLLGSSSSTRCGDAISSFAMLCSPSSLLATGLQSNANDEIASPQRVDELEPKSY
eukprot:471754-Prorocentrum_minimum.AAC.1